MQSCLMRAKLLKSGYSMRVGAEAKPKHVVLAQTIPWSGVKACTAVTDAAGLAAVQL